MVRIGRGQSGHRTLKLTVSQKWIDGMNWYFARWCKFTLQSYFNYFLVGVIRNGHGNLNHETLKSAASKEWVYELSWFFACWLWGNNFWSDRHCTLYLLFYLQPMAVVFVGPLAVAKRVLWNRVCLAFHPAFCWGVFLELGH